MPPVDYDDERHRREEAARREKRKAAKAQKSESQLEKERKRKEHAQKILQKHGGGDKKKQKTTTEVVSSSAFQALFKQRAQGFEISFKFRNAPPRPPVGPSFVGADLDEKLREISQYKPLNAVEVNYRWKLHSEPDLGVPLAPSAMDLSSYKFSNTDDTNLDPGDMNILDWKGSMGDTAAEELKKSRDNARATARMALIGKTPIKLEKSKSPLSASASTKKAFSRVLDEGMQSWMKKTTYITNDYSRKVHDFKSLAKTKQELEQDLEVRQQQISLHRSAAAVSKTFEECKQSVHKHPTKQNVKPVAEMPFLPDVTHWGNAYTHVVVDKSPGDDETLSRLDKAFIANVQKRDAASRMTCQMFIQSDEINPDSYQAVQQYELDVVPLKEEDTPHVNFCIWVDPESGKASYVPISSRVQLSVGRPIKKLDYNMKITRRTRTDEDTREIEERLAEVDADIDKKINGTSGGTDEVKEMQMTTADSGNDSDHEDSFMNTRKTIVAEN